MIKNFKNILFFFLAIAIINLIFNRGFRKLLPKPEIPIVTSKIEVWKARKEDYDTVFIGDSRIYQNLSPDVFDRCAARSGEKTNSYNMGIPAMSLGEMRTIIQELLQKKTFTITLCYHSSIPSLAW